MTHQDYLTVAMTLARKAGRIIRQNLTIGREKTWKKDHTPVTVVDKQINALVIETIHRQFPAHSILSEEGSDMKRSQELVWVCDPIDGTFPYMAGIPVSTFVLALVKNGQPILGLIYDPFQDRLYHALKGQGSYLNGTRISTSSSRVLEHQVIGTVFWKDNIDYLSPVIAKIAKNRVTFMNLVSIAYMDAMVASGDLIATIFPGTSPHDSAAAKIIIEEAGGVFTSLTGEIDRYDKQVHGHLAAGSQEIYQQIKDIFQVSSPKHIR